MLGLSAGLHYPKFTSSIIRLNVGRKGFIQGVSNSNFTTAHQMPNASSIADTATGTKTIQYLQTSSRGGTSHRFQRIYLYFNVSGVSTISSAKLELKFSSTPDANLILIPSTAFGGDGGTALGALDYFVNSDYTSAPYSDSYTVDGTSGVKAIPLSAAGVNAINNNDSFITALIEYDVDEQISDPGSSTNRTTTIDLSSEVVLILQ